MREFSKLNFHCVVCWQASSLAVYANRKFLDINRINCYHINVVIRAISVLFEMSNTKYFKSFNMVNVYVAYFQNLKKNRLPSVFVLMMTSVADDGN